MATFEYTPLQDIGDYESVQNGRSIRESEKIVDGSWEIRLIRLLPSKSRAVPIECELLYRTFKSVKGDYEALSYVWVDSNGIEGVHQLPSHITLNGHAFHITPNLHAALRRLRDLSHDRTLWIDQICINQADIQERNRQVDRMTLIYGYAKRTVIWLGEEACESFRAVLLLRGLARVAREKDYEAMLAAATREFSDISRWKALGLLFKRAWWHRTWVVQECAVTKDLVVICGYRDISWKDLMSAVMVIGLLREKNLMPLCVYRVDNSSVSALHKSRLLVAARGDSTMKSASERSHFDSLLDVLTRYRSRQASNARDKVYALLRLAQDFRDIVSATSTNPIPIDYAKSVEEVYHDVARFLLTSTQRLDFLSHCRLKRNLASLPSWIPDWSDTAKVPHPLIGPYSTTGTSSAIAHITAHRLNAQALLFDCVQTTSDLCTATDFSHSSLSPTFRRWKALALDHRPQTARADEGLQPQHQQECEQEKEHEQEREQAFLRTLLADRVRNTRLDRTTLSSTIAAYRIWAARAPPTDSGLASGLRVHDVLETLDFSYALQRACLGRRFFVSGQGALGLGPAETEAGDVLVAVRGVRVPVVVRMGEGLGEEGVLVGEWWVACLFDSCGCFAD